MAVCVADGRTMSTTPDPRPTVVADGNDWVVTGLRCAGCGYVTFARPPRCPECRHELVAASFGPLGTVWSSTVVRVAVPGRTPPYGLAYVDLANGPRVLAHVSSGDTRLAVGTTVVVVASSPEGDVTVEEPAA